MKTAAESASFSFEEDGVLALFCAVVADGSGPGRAVLVVKNGNVVSERTLFDATITSLPGFEVEKGFVF